MECDGITKKYIRVSRNESKKSEEADGRKRLQRQVSQRADDVGWMSNREKGKDESKRRRIGVNRNRSYFYTTENTHGPSDIIPCDVTSLF